MNFNHLSVFHAVAEERSISRAANRLMVSQPAVSKQLSELERSLKTKLVDRLPRGVRLTASGELLIGYARRIFAQAEEAERAMGELAGGRRGRLAVAATPTIGTYWLPSLLVKYRRIYPGVEMRMEVHPTTTIARLLLDGAVDVGLAESAAESEGIDSSVFMTDRMTAIAPPMHPFTRRRTISAEELCRVPFVVRELGSGSKSLVERALLERGLKVEPVMSLGSTEAIKRAVMEGVGVAIVSGLAVGLEVAAGKLAALRVKGLSVERRCYLLAAKGRHPSVAVQGFVRMVEAVDPDAMR
jgi:DNA-binding transcriptional LysR family regulator